jgi:hypothetical protein
MVDGPAHAGASRPAPPPAILHDAKRSPECIGWSAEDHNADVRTTGKRTARNAVYALARALRITHPPDHPHRPRVPPHRRTRLTPLHG